jgi:hypothetical protein
MVKPLAAIPPSQATLNVAVRPMRFATNDDPGAASTVLCAVSPGGDLVAFSQKGGRPIQSELGQKGHSKGSTVHLRLSRGIRKSAPVFHLKGSTCR